MTQTHWSTRYIPLLFVFLWSTGFIGAKYTLPYIDPFYLLFLRMLLTLAVFIALMWWFKAPKLTTKQIGHQVVSGLLIHGAYLGGVFAAIKYQMPAGVTALIVSLQPLLTALFLLTTTSLTFTGRQWLGLFLGFFGVAMVLASKGALESFSFTWTMLVGVSVALVGITFGTLYQKRFCAEVNLLSASVVQYMATAVLMALLTYSFEAQQVDWQWPLIGGLAWLVFGLSVSAIFLLLYMIEKGEAAKVASYFYLVPGVTAVEAWLLFGESITVYTCTGILISLLGVVMSTRGRGAD